MACYKIDLKSQKKKKNLNLYRVDGKLTYHRVFLASPPQIAQADALFHGHPDGKKGLLFVVALVAQAGGLRGWARFAF